MNTLTANQLQHIDQFLLEHYRLYYIDLRAEVVDHIATSIESEIHSGKGYEEAFVVVIAQWNDLLQPSSFFFRGIPKFIAKQWTKARLNRGLKAMGFGVITTVLLASFFFRFLDLDVDTAWGIGLLLSLYAGIGILYLYNHRLVKNVPLHTATGTFLRIEFKRLGWVQSVFVIMPLLRMVTQSIEEWFVFTYFFVGFIMLFYMIHWKMDYQKETLDQIKWKNI